MRRNHDLDAGLAVLDEAGIRDITVAHGGKHAQLRWTVGGRLRMVTIPVSASDFRSAANTRSEVRKLLRADGVLTKTNRASHPSPRPDWREQIEILVRRFKRIPVPSEKAAERTTIVIALRRLMDIDDSMQVTGEREAAA